MDPVALQQLLGSLSIDRKNSAKNKVTEPKQPPKISADLTKLSKVAQPKAQRKASPSSSLHKRSGFSGEIFAVEPQLMRSSDEFDSQRSKLQPSKSARGSEWVELPRAEYFDRVPSRVAAASGGSRSAPTTPLKQRGGSPPPSAHTGAAEVTAPPPNRSPTRRLKNMLRRSRTKQAQEQRQQPTRVEELKLKHATKGGAYSMEPVSRDATARRSSSQRKLGTASQKQQQQQQQQQHQQASIDPNVPIRNSKLAQKFSRLMKVYDNDA